MLTKGGAKLLDFGLAKFQASGPQQVMSGVSVLATEAPQNLTAEGSIVGTFQYMSPEQLEGKDADSRTDIFALGTVLYEMITGRKAFIGKSQASLIAAILDKDPQPMSELQPMTPPALERVVKTCLAKDPDDRWQSAHDVASELKWISEAGSAAGVATPRARSRRRLAWVGWLVAAAIAIAWITTVVFQKPVSESRIETSIVPPDGVILDLARGGIALSPRRASTRFCRAPVGRAEASLGPGSRLPGQQAARGDGRCLDSLLVARRKTDRVLGWKNKAFPGPSRRRFLPVRRRRQYLRRYLDPGYSDSLFERAGDLSRSGIGRDSDEVVRHAGLPTH